MSTFGHSGFTCDNVQWWKECSVSTTVLTSTGRQTCVCMYVCECECVYLQARWWWRRAGSRCRMSGRWLQKRRESDSRCLESLRSVKQREQQWERSSQTNIYKPRIWDIRYKKMYCLCFTHTHTHTHTSCWSTASLWRQASDSLQDFSSSSSGSTEEFWESDLK